MTGLALLLCAGLSGCEAFRGETGLGYGFGLELKAPGLAHTGLGYGRFRHEGFHYQYGLEIATTEESLLLLLWHRDRDESGLLQHICPCLLPPLTTYAGDRERRQDVWALELGLMLFFFDVRMGIDFAALLERVVR